MGGQNRLIPNIVWCGMSGLPILRSFDLYPLGLVSRCEIEYTIIKNKNFFILINYFLKNQTR